MTVNKNKFFLNIDLWENSFDTGYSTNKKLLFHRNLYIRKCKIMEIDERCKEIQKNFSSGTVYRLLNKIAN